MTLADLRERRLAPSIGKGGRGMLTIFPMWPRSHRQYTTRSGIHLTYPSLARTYAEDPGTASDCAGLSLQREYVRYPAT
jgi:hypothetical protein